ncbi:hypothetical protein D1007_14662 [Hordeum vulgare]|nr:hypothetical protein D1007_14662 [Hordeum vulgare]
MDERAKIWRGGVWVPALGFNSQARIKQLVGTAPRDVHTAAAEEASVGPSGFRTILCGSTSSDGRGGRARAPPYSSHIWDGYEGCRSARASKAGLRGRLDRNLVIGE